jgi:hypothetical protein
MEKKGLPSWNVQLHHSLRHRSVEKGTSRTTTLHCLYPSLLSQTLEPSGYQTSGRYGEEPARDAIVQYFVLRKFLEQARALESIPADEVEQVSCEDLGD